MHSVRATWLLCLLASVWHAHALLPGLRPHTRAAAPLSAIVMAERFEVCLGKHCRKRGSKATLARFEELAAGRDGVIVEAADMSHTEHGCFE